MAVFVMTPSSMAYYISPLAVYSFFFFLLRLVMSEISKVLERSISQLCMAYCMSQNGLLDHCNPKFRIIIPSQKYFDAQLFM